MTEKIGMIAIGIAYGVSGILLFSRMYKWNTDSLRWIITSILLIISIVNLPIEGTDKEINFIKFCLKVPFIHNIIDRLFKAISIKVYNRDFYLWLRGSDDIAPSIFDRNPHVKPLDKVFSIILLFSLLFMPMLGM